VLAALSACDHTNSGGSPDDATPGPNDDGTGPGDPPRGRTEDEEPRNPETPEDTAQGWFAGNTIAHRGDLPVAALGATLDAQALANQLAGYDPGSLLRCAVSDDAAYQAAIDALGGVSWGYQVSVLDDLSKPRFQAGLPKPPILLPTAGFADASAAPVEIVKPDIVAVTEAAALFYSSSHGLMLVNLTGDEPTFECATQLPGVVNQFFFHDGHLVAMTRRHGARGASFLVHFAVDGATLRFVETVDLGEGNILDSRRFNDKLVFYTDLRLASDPEPVEQGGFAAGDWAPGYGQPLHRALRVFTLGDRLSEELHDTLLDTTVSEAQLIDEGVADDTALGTAVHESRRFGQNMWASDHYFAVTEEITTTRFSGWATNVYSICTQSHVVESTYTHCVTEYETRPNPDYVPPDNSAGDRACTGVTLSDCLRRVARVSNETIQVAVGQVCEERPTQRWICDRYEQQTSRYPTFSYETTTQLFIYEYAPSGFVRLDTSVREITNQGLGALSMDDTVPVLTTSAETFDLAVPGAVQTLYFQNGILYVISQGVLQVYTLSGSSLVRTATLAVVNDSLQSSLFTEDKLFLSDFGYRGFMDESVLRVVNLSNPAFPTIDGATHALPGGHSSIIASRHGIFTIGAVQRFDGQNVNVIKLGLFSDPYAAEVAYLILATTLDHTWLGNDEARFFSSPEQRLLLPYWGQDDGFDQEHRVSVSRVVPGQILSEGAVTVPEFVQRVRPIDAAQTAFLTFADSSIEWLTPSGEEWQSRPVLEYFKPFALLRLNDEDDYAEVQRLGNRCKVFLANTSDINEREDGIVSEAFDCAANAGVRAFDRTLLFQDRAVEFGDQGEIRELTSAERTEIEARIAARETCLLSLEIVDDVSIDYTMDHERSDFTCVSPEELQRLTSEAHARAGTP
jgi:hypothetical protein